LPLLQQGHGFPVSLASSSSPPAPPQPPHFSSAASSSDFHHAEADPRDQGLPPDCEEEGREVGADQEDQGRRQVQGPVLQVPLHPLRLRRRQGQQAQAVAPPRFDCPGGLSIKARPCCL
uniref:Uncharacterized protein n=1 Tax=Oryza punctata TaxID=4537 RepID=A0A0E0LLX3_ORYPU